MTTAAAARKETRSEIEPAIQPDLSLTARILAHLASLNSNVHPPSGAAIAHGVGCNRGTVTSQVKRLKRAGLLLAVGRNGWKLSAAGRAAAAAARAQPARRDDLRARFWAVLRRLKKATAADLVTLAGGGPGRPPLVDARRWLAALERAGYVAALASRRPTAGGGQQKVYLLVDDPGPRPPVVNLDSQVVSDRNRGQARRVSKVRDQESEEGYGV